MGLLLLDMYNWGLRMRRECGNVFPATTDYWSRHASRHVRDARAVMPAGIAN